jgi:hypothetical protein
MELKKILKKAPTRASKVPINMPVFSLYKLKTDVYNCVLWLLHNNAFIFITDSWVHYMDAYTYVYYINFQEHVCKTLQKFSLLYKDQNEVMEWICIVLYSPCSKQYCSSCNVTYTGQSTQQRDTHFRHLCLNALCLKCFNCRLGWCWGLEVDKPVPWKHNQSLIRLHHT